MSRTHCQCSIQGRTQIFSTQVVVFLECQGLTDKASYKGVHKSLLLKSSSFWSIQNSLPRLHTRAYTNLFYLSRRLSGVSRTHCQCSIQGRTQIFSTQVVVFLECQGLTAKASYKGVHKSLLLKSSSFWSVQDSLPRLHTRAYTNLFYLSRRLSGVSRTHCIGSIQGRTQTSST